ncbi:MAG: EVE domain-containing protein [Acidobacteriota bacterium]
MVSETRYWLFKSEPNAYSIDDLAKDGWTYWDGVRNYQARNLLRDEVNVGDGVLFYHSNAKPPGIAGIARVTRSGYPDPTQFDTESKYFDPKATEAKPRWFVVDIEFVSKLDEVVSLASLKADEALDGMLVTRKGQRLSVQPVEDRHWHYLLEQSK